MEWNALCWPLVGAKDPKFVLHWLLHSACMPCFFAATLPDEPAPCHYKTCISLTLYPLWEIMPWLVPPCCVEFQDVSHFLYLLVHPVPGPVLLSGDASGSHNGRHRCSWSAVCFFSKLACIRPGALYWRPFLWCLPPWWLLWSALRPAIMSIDWPRGFSLACCIVG